MNHAPVALGVEPLSAAAFAPFGEVIEAAAARATIAVNNGTARRFHDLARIDTATHGGHPVLSLFRAQPRPLPFELELVERHPLGSQAFVPLGDARYLVVVTESPEATPRAFRAAPGQGVNYARGVWHHPLIVIGSEADFLVIDRDGPGDNCEERALSRRWLLRG